MRRAPKVIGDDEDSYGIFRSLSALVKALTCDLSGLKGSDCGAKIVSVTTLEIGCESTWHSQVVEPVEIRYCVAPPLEKYLMRRFVLALPFLLLTASCSGCSDSDNNPAPSADAGVVAPAGDAGAAVADSGAPPVVEPDNAILGTWRFTAPMEGSGVDGVSFYIDGKAAIYSGVAECQVANQGTWSVEGDQLTITIGEQPGRPQLYKVEGNALEITPEGMEMMALTRVEPACEQPEDNGSLQEILTATWRVEGQGENGHILSQMGRYVRSDNVAECTQAQIGQWALVGLELRIRIGEQEQIFQVALQEDGNLEMRVEGGDPQRWIRAEENCEQRPNEYNIVGTWTPSVQDQPTYAFTMAQEAKIITNLAECTASDTRQFALTSAPAELILVGSSEEDPALVHQFRAIDENSFALTKEGLEVVYTRAEQNCHGDDMPQDLDYDIIGTWTSEDDGAPDFAFSEQNAGMSVQSVQTCAMTEVFSYRLADGPPRLEIYRDPEGVPNPNQQPQVDSYEFRASGPGAFAITKDGVTWRYSKTTANCHTGGGEAGVPLDYPIVGTWITDGPHRALSLNRDDQGFFGQYLTNVEGCIAGEGFSYTLSGDPPEFVVIMNRNNQMVRVPHPFRRISDDSFALTIEGEAVTYRRSEQNCHNAGAEQELQFNIIGTWGTVNENQPTLAFRRDNIGNLGQEISALETCLVQASFSFRLLAEPPTLERLYTDDQGGVDERRQPFRSANADSFTVIINGREVTYTRLESDCHTRNDGPPPPEELDAQQLLGTWQAQGNTGFAFGANNAFKKLSNTNECGVELEGTYELAGNLLTMTPGGNQRPLFYAAAMPDANTLRLTDDNQQLTQLTRIQRNCF